MPSRSDQPLIYFTSSCGGTFGESALTSSVPLLSSKCKHHSLRTVPHPFAAFLPPFIQPHENKPNCTDTYFHPCQGTPPRQPDIPSGLFFLIKYSRFLNYEPALLFNFNTSIRCLIWQWTATPTPFTFLGRRLATLTRKRLIHYYITRVLKFKIRKLRKTSRVRVKSLMLWKIIGSAFIVAFNRAISITNMNVIVWDRWRGN
jgi:hypothetical protein